MADKIPLIGDLPQITEVIIDLGIGIFVILLFSPFIYAVNLFMTGNIIDFNCFVTIFPETWKLFKDIGIGAGLLGFFFVYVLGIASRSVLFLTISVFRFFGSRWVEKNIFLGLVYRIIKGQYGEELNFTEEEIRENFIDKGLFWQVGDPNYSSFRTELARDGCYLNEHKSYWDHEAFMCFLFERLYSLFLTFFSFYSIYLLILYTYLAINSKALFPGFWGGLLIWIVSSIIVISLYKEMIFHGMAFVRIEEVLLKLFETENDAEKWSEYEKAIRQIKNENKKKEK